MTTPQYTNILMSGRNPSLVNQGLKTQTRRTGELDYINKAPGDWALRSMDHRAGKLFASFERDRYGLKHGEASGVSIPCPYGRVGDFLRVREAWQLVRWSTNGSGRGQEVRYRADNSTRRCHLPDSDNFYDHHYDSLCRFAERTQDARKAGKDLWFPGIHMPLWACRSVLEIVSVKVERLNDISEEDARAEGILDGGCCTCGNSSYPHPCGCTNPRPLYVDAFIRLWRSIHGEESWDTNPWVWRIKFRKVEA